MKRIKGKYKDIMFMNSKQNNHEKKFGCRAVFAKYAYQMGCTE